MVERLRSCSTCCFLTGDYLPPSDYIWPPAGRSLWVKGPARLQNWGWLSGEWDGDEAIVKLARELPLGKDSVAAPPLFNGRGRISMEPFVGSSDFPAVLQLQLHSISGHRESRDVPGSTVSLILL